MVTILKDPRTGPRTPKVQPNHLAIILILFVELLKKSIEASKIHLHIRLHIRLRLHHQNQMLKIICTEQKGLDAAEKVYNIRESNPGLSRGRGVFYH